MALMVPSRKTRVIRRKLNCLNPLIKAKAKLPEPTD
jgi:hypothetical protein